MKPDKWQGAELALRQWGVAKEELDAYRRGVVGDAWKVLAGIVAELDAPDPIVMLDVGCGIGAASEILAGVSGRELDYWGADCNGEAISIAWSEFPKHHFMPSDILTMPTDPIFDLVMSNGTLNHVAEWSKAIENMAALSRRWILLHRLWIQWGDAPTSKVLQQTYGCNLWALRINRNELVSLMWGLGFELQTECSSDGSQDPKAGQTYLFAKGG